MPRKARIDAPGSLHHVICRGIERRRIFLDDTDCGEFVRRLAVVIKDTQTFCYAWALMPNHFHLLLRTGATPITTVMQRVLSGYAGAFNRRHRRIGQLFHNRYKSILCQEDAYLLELTRYIHLNPLRARIVKSLEELDLYPYAGHGALMGRHANDWQETDKILAQFGSRASAARKAYRSFVEAGIAEGRKRELTGGGLVRSAGGWGAIKVRRKAHDHQKGDERILGDGEFVATVLEAQREKLERRYRLKAKGIDLSKLIERVAEVSGVNAEQIRNPGKQPERVRARSLVCYLAVSELAATTVALSKELGICQSAVSKAVARGRKYAGDLNTKIDRKCLFRNRPMLPSASTCCQSITL
jgi:REP element-mobilizing transposase RayT